MIQLPEVCLVAVDTLRPERAEESLLRSMSQIKPAGTILFTHRPFDCDPRITLRIIPQFPPDWKRAYSLFVLREMVKHLPTYCTHALVTQWDGWVLDGQLWDPSWLKLDYIGAVWPWHPVGWRVGNGGFSLRSLSLMWRVAALTSSPLFDLPSGIEGNEDGVICHRLKWLLECEGFSFAAEAQASQFSLEHGDFHPTFGFHGDFNFSRVLAHEHFLDQIATEERSTKAAGG